MVSFRLAFLVGEKFLPWQVRDFGSKVAFATVDANAEKDLAKRYVPSGNYPQLMWSLARQNPLGFAKCGLIHMRHQRIERLGMWEGILVCNIHSSNILVKRLQYVSHAGVATCGKWSNFFKEYQCCLNRCFSRVKTSCHLTPS